MRNLNRNKQPMHYAVLIGTEPIYVLDDEGNPVIAYVDDDGNVYYQETGNYRNIYSAPVSFDGNIATTGGESESVPFGLNTGDYSAVLVVEKGILPISESSLIWHETIPEVDSNGYAKEASADYRVAKKAPSLNEMKYVLDKLVK